jgi:hypothetical protein
MMPEARFHPLAGDRIQRVPGGREGVLNRARRDLKGSVRPGGALEEQRT